MTLREFGNMKFLLGFWSCLAFVAGLAGALACYVSSKMQNSRSRIGARAKLSGTLAAAMFSFSAFVLLCVLPASLAYSGPAMPWPRDLWRFDKYFASRVGLTFSAAFAFDWVRLKLRQK
jgi:hypothetical protein